MTEETYDIVLGARVSKRLNDKILDVQQSFVKKTGVKPSINEIVRMLLEKGLEAYGHPLGLPLGQKHVNGKRR